VKLSSPEYISVANSPAWQGWQNPETSAFISQSEISPIGALGFLWCSNASPVLEIFLSVRAELAKAETKPRD
jgi:hypothetical protein